MQFAGRCRATVVGFVWLMWESQVRWSAVDQKRGAGSVERIASRADLKWGGLSGLSKLLECHFAINFQKSSIFNPSGLFGTLGVATLGGLAEVEGRLSLIVLQEAFRRCDSLVLHYFGAFEGIALVFRDHIPLPQNGFFRTSDCFSRSRLARGRWNGESCSFFLSGYGGFSMKPWIHLVSGRFRAALRSRVILRPKA